jgi:dihydrofolate reductase
MSGRDHIGQIWTALARRATHLGASADNHQIQAGGPSTVRQFLQADLVDFMHLVIVPITLGRGVSLWEGSSGIEDRFTVEAVTSPSGLTHQFWNKNDHV